MIRITDRVDMTTAVYHGRSTKNNGKKIKRSILNAKILAPTAFFVQNDIYIFYIFFD